MVLILLSGGFNVVPGKIHAIPAVIAKVLSYAVSTLLSLALVYALLKSVDGEKVSITDAVSKPLNRFSNYFVAQILITISVLIGLVFLIIPGIIIGIRLSLVGYFIVDKNIGPVEAYKASLAATKGKTKVIWSIVLAALAYALLFLTIIGIPIAVYLLFMYSAATAIAYRYLTRSELSNSAPAAAFKAPTSPVGPQVAPPSPQV
ncbi:MAG: YciC family protein [Patescibacteria group bacterium]|nr:YciC family protein [Patescibacteria group bacterium]